MRALQLAAHLAMFTGFMAPPTTATSPSPHNNNNYNNHNHHHPTCTPETALKRKEYSDLTDTEKRSFIHGLQCLMALPSTQPPGLVPAATNRWLDFTTSHVNHSTTIHFDGLLLPWHRHYLFLLERALHTECGYPSTLGLPYWDYLRHPNLTTNPIFFAAADAPNTSLGGTGSGPNGCLTTGPFANSTITFGPFPPPTKAGVTLPANWTAANPRCIQRGLAPAELANASSIAALLAAPNIRGVLAWMHGSSLHPEGKTLRGVHGGAHAAIGGTALDFFGSAQEPAFPLLHAGLDRLWALWQDAHPALRWTYNGTSTFLSPVGPTPEVGNGTVMEFAPVGEPFLVGRTADTLSGDPYCFVYV